MKRPDSLDVELWWLWHCSLWSNTRSLENSCASLDSWRSMRHGVARTDAFCCTLLVQWERPLSTSHWGWWCMGNVWSGGLLMWWQHLHFKIIEVLAGIGALPFEYAKDIEEDRGHKRTQYGSHPINPMIIRETPTDDVRTEGTSRIDTSSSIVDTFTMLAEQLGICRWSYWAYVRWKERFQFRWVQETSLYVSQPPAWWPRIPAAK